MKRFNTRVMLAMLALSSFVLFSSCKKETEDPPINETHRYLNLGSAENKGYTIKVLAADSFFVGYNNVYFEITDEQDNIVDVAQIALSPSMDMGSMTHGAPVENPGMNADPDNFKLFSGAIVFQIGSMGMMRWSLIVEAEIDGDNYQFTIDPIRVIELADTRAKVLMGNSSIKIIAAWKSPMNAEIGMNDMSLTLHEMRGPYEFLPIEDFTIEMEPEMPSMGHGSPNNVDPTHSANGHYEGIVNFTMSGHWTVTFKLTNEQGQMEADDLLFDIRF